MNIKALFLTIGKLLIGALVFTVGSVAGSMAAGLLGMPVPQMPPEIDAARVGQTVPLVGLLMAAALALLSRQMAVGFLPRWLILGLFSWTAYGLNNYLEAKLFTPGMATSYVLVMNFIACFAISAAVAWLFKPAAPVAPFWIKVRAFCAARSVGPWTWRFLAALAAFPAAYFVFGLIVSPFVVSYYQQQYAGLALPTIGQMIPLSFLRSLLYLLSVLPLLFAWKGGRLSLFLALGVALFMLVGGLSMFQAIWMPVTLRATHSLEILADSFVHAAALVFLLVPGVPTESPAPVMGRIKTSSKTS